MSSDSDMLLYGVPIIAFWDMETKSGCYYPGDTLFRIIDDPDTSLQKFFINYILKHGSEYFRLPRRLRNLKYENGRIVRQNGAPIPRADLNTVLLGIAKVLYMYEC